jgi:hypothetical protein
MFEQAGQSSDLVEIAKAQRRLQKEPRNSSWRFPLFALAQRRARPFVALLRLDRGCAFRRAALAKDTRLSVATDPLRRIERRWSLCMMTVFVITTPIVRNSLEEAAAVGMGIGMIVFAVNYPVGFGMTMAVFFLIVAVCLALPSASLRR